MRSRKDKKQNEKEERRKMKRKTTEYNQTNLDYDAEED